MHTLEETIEALNCFTTKQHKCAACPFNPHPGREWPYGCVRGQNDIVAEAQERLREAAEENTARG